MMDGSPDQLWVEVYDNPGHLLVDRVPVNPDGSFHVNVVTTHVVEVRVVSRQGDRITNDFVQFRSGQPVEIRMPKSLSSGLKPGGPVSAMRLSHKPVKMAKRLMAEAETLAADGRFPDSAARLEKALQADPNWFEAWNNLGSRRLQMGNYAESVEAFQHALRIDPNSALVQTNLGLALLFQRNSVAAEEAARKALQLDPESAQANYVSGLALLQQNKRVDEALSSLRVAAKVVPRALLATAEWHCRHNEFAACVGDLKTFLRTPRGPNHPAAEKWLGEVKKVWKGD